ncbi:MAG: DUF4258 domain-containing protein [Armatimonadota bacterium]
MAPSCAGATSGRGISRAEVVDALLNGEVIEAYPVYAQGGKRREQSLGTLSTLRW